MTAKKSQLRSKLTRWRKPIIIGVVVLIGIPALISLLYAGYTMQYRGKIYPNTYIGNTNFGGKTTAQAEEQLTATVKNIPSDITIRFDGEEKTKLPLSQLGTEFKTNETARELFSVGRRASFSDSLTEITKSIFSKNDQAAQFTFNNEKTAGELTKIVAALGTKAHDATIVIENETTLTIKPEKDGNGISEEELQRELRNSLSQFKSEVTLTSHILKPKVVSAQLEPLLEEAKDVVSKAPVTLIAEDKKTTADAKTIFSWLDLGVNTTPTPSPVPSVTQSSPPPTAAHSFSSVKFDEEAIKTYVATFASTVNRDAENAQLGVVDGQVKVTRPHVNGKKVKVDESVKTLTETLSSDDTQSNSTVTLAMEEDAAKIQESTIASLGIKELIGHGETNFKGSPANRVHNLKTGTNFLNGAIIAPGAEFSTVSTLGAVDGSTGYLPELVIKDNKTTPEFGGGLCQVSTTLFRSVMNAGLRVTERHNHSYRVSYYEPPIGLDATIYLPKPDFKFKNDTPGYILMQGKVEGTKITFDLYGTKDGRTSSISEPIITNITEPPDPQYVETDTLKKGETKQIEKAHQGANAVVTYTVTKDGKELFKQTFRSRYKAWQARYLVGTREE